MTMAVRPLRELLRDIRERAGVTLEDFGEEIGRAPEYVGRIEQGHSPITQAETNVSAI